MNVPRGERGKMFERWAEERRLVPHGHDAAYAGDIAGVRIGVETGVRDTGLYDVVVTLDLSCLIEPVLLKRSKTSESAHRVLRVAEELLAEQETMRSISIEETQVVVRWWRNVAFEQIDEAVQRLVEAWRTLAPYR